jgi:hypothetical protein
VLANFASRIAAGERPMIFEDGRQRRDFVHVEDVRRAFRLALEAPSAPGHVINIGSGRSYSIAEVAADPRRKPWAARSSPEILGKARSGDIRHCYADIGKARELLGFSPRLHLEDSLGPFVEWVPRKPTAISARDAPAARGAGLGVMNGREQRAFRLRRAVPPGERDRAERALEGIAATPARRLRTELSRAEFQAPGGAEWYDWLIPTLASRFELLPCIAPRALVPVLGRGGGRWAAPP